MKTIRRIFWVHVLVATIGLMAGYALLGEWRIVPVFLLVLALWLFAQMRGAGTFGGIFLFFLLLASVVAIFMGVPGWLALLSAVAALGAWDLDHFLRRLNAVERVAFETGLGRAHLLRLALVEGIGLLAGLLALSVSLRLPFWWEVLLVVLAMIGLSRLIEFTRAQVED